MDATTAAKVLIEMGLTEKDGYCCIDQNSIYSLGWYLAADRDSACLDGDFTADHLEAIAAWLRNHDEVYAAVVTHLPPQPQPPGEHEHSAPSDEKAP